jgi:hypothetical protein
VRSRPDTVTEGTKIRELSPVKPAQINISLPTRDGVSNSGTQEAPILFPVAAISQVFAFGGPILRQQVICNTQVATKGEGTTENPVKIVVVVGVAALVVKV